MFNTMCNGYEGAKSVPGTPCCHRVGAYSSLLTNPIVNVSVETMDIDSLSTKY